MTISAPTLAGYTDFLRNVAKINPTVLPGNTPVIEMSYCIALEIVNLSLALMGCRIYALAVYNLATSNLLSYAPDQSGSTYFEDIRKKWNLNDFITGVVESTSDNGSSESMVVQDAAKTFTLSNLQNLKDPYGRAYLAFAQDYGTLWGLTR